ncbi:MAG: hypothetical protein RM368_19090 [Nostoc sp. DedSLP03]|uniref:hypothetical protein n=1 Tax=Nostoc sp. DedSLP03 TaxID=3075400 RepID=UPI002AD42125|nr:hypothetical protein [Nostoc sp. DedSLP03]MDZ7967050.1 hypothetical protein [Nostoc sp. DedSLP03]
MFSWLGSEQLAKFHTVTLNQARTSSVMVDGTTAKGDVSLLLSPVNTPLGTEF